MKMAMKTRGGVGGVEWSQGRDGRRHDVSHGLRRGLCRRRWVITQFAKTWLKRMHHDPAILPLEKYSKN